MGNRQTLLTLIQKRQPKYRNASHEDRISKMIGGGAVPFDSISGISETLAAANIAHALVGGQAAIRYGSPRTTVDADYLIGKNDLDKAISVLGGRDAVPLTIGGCSIMVGAVMVDLRAIDRPWVADAIGSATGPNHLVSRPYLALMKMWSARGAGEDMDVAHVIKSMSAEEREMTRKLVVRYLPKDVDDLDTLIALSRLV